MPEVLSEHNLAFITLIHHNSLLFDNDITRNGVKRLFKEYLMGAQPPIDIFVRFMCVLKRYSTKKSLNNTHIRTLLLTIVGHELYKEHGNSSFAHAHVYDKIRELCGGHELSLWSGQRSHNFTTQIRTALHEHCPNSSQFWFRHNTLIKQRNTPLFINCNIGEQNMNRNWTKGNTGKRYTQSQWHFNIACLNEHELSQVNELFVPTLENISIIARTRNDGIVHRKDGGAKDKWHDHFSQLQVYY